MGTPKSRDGGGGTGGGGEREGWMVGDPEREEKREKKLGGA